MQKLVHLQLLFLQSIFPRDRRILQRAMVAAPALCKGRVEAAHLGDPVAGAVRSELRIARPPSTGKRRAHMQLMAGLFHACARTFHDPCSFLPPSAKSTRFFLCNWPVHLTFGILGAICQITFYAPLPQTAAPGEVLPKASILFSNAASNSGSARF